MGFWYCVAYAAALGAVSFLLGRILPASWFDPTHAPWRSWKWEMDGKIYQKLGVHRWQNKVPDMSRVFPKIMPAKSMKTIPDQRGLKTMIHETCVAEAVHSLLCVLGLYMLRLWRGLGGVIFYLVYVLAGNLPFLLIQRYNRPRLMRVYLRREKQKEGS